MIFHWVKYLRCFWFNFDNVKNKSFHHKTISVVRIKCWCCTFLQNTATIHLYVLYKPCWLRLRRWSRSSSNQKVAGLIPGMHIWASSWNCSWWAGRHCVWMDESVVELRVHLPYRRFYLHYLHEVTLMSCRGEKNAAVWDSLLRKMGYFPAEQWRKRSIFKETLGRFQATQVRDDLCVTLTGPQAQRGIPLRSVETWTDRN